MQINLNKAHFPVTVLGPGRRIGIWLQGCSIGCKGCISRDTWNADSNKKVSIAKLIDWCKQTSRGEFDGVTISGGEPFDQPKALGALLDALHGWRKQLQSDFDILCYSGYPLSRLKAGHPDIIAKLDALIPEPFIDQQPTDQLWCGSANQSLQLLTDTAQRKYAPYLEPTDRQQNKQIQLMLDDKKVWTIGIPQRGDMQKLEAQCREQGLHFEQVSWRA